MAVRGLVRGEFVRRRMERVFLVILACYLALIGRMVYLQGAQGPELRFLETLSHRRVILLVNKVDVGKKKPLLDALPVSAKTGQGLDDVRRKILRALAVNPRHVPGEPVVFTSRQERLLARAASGRMDLEEAREELFRGA